MTECVEYNRLADVMRMHARKQQAARVAGSLQEMRDEEQKMELALAALRTHAADCAQCAAWRERVTKRVREEIERESRGTGLAQRAGVRDGAGTDGGTGSGAVRKAGGVGLAADVAGGARKGAEVRDV